MELQQYFERGWVILPIPRKQKKIVMKWKHLQNDPAALEKSRDFWATYDKASNAAIMCGENSGVIIIDLDPKHMDIDPLVFISQFPSTCVVRTPRGGWHLYFKYPKGLKLGNRRGSLPKGIDVRGQGGYALLPPSYVEYDDGSDPGEYRWEEFGELPPLPQEIIDMIQSGPDEAPTRSENEEKLARILQGDFTPGEHNEELFWAAGYMLARGLGEDVVLPMLVAADSLDPSPQGYQQVSATVRQAVAYHHERQAENVYQFVVDQQPVISNSIAQNSPEKRKPDLGVMPLAEYAAEFAAEQRFLLPGWVPLNSLLMMTAAPEAGKTWLLMDMAVSVALGNKIDPAGFLGEAPSMWDRPQNVLFIQQEDQPGKITERLEAIYNAHLRRAGNPLRVGFDEQGNFHAASAYDLPGQVYLLRQANFSFAREGAIDELEETIRRLNIKLVLIDPMYMLGDTSNYFAEFARYFSDLKGLRNQYGFTIIIAHHAKKLNGGAGDRGNAWGSTFLDAASEGQIMLYPDKNKTADDGSKFLNITCSGKSFDRPVTREGWLRLSTMPGDEKVLFETIDPLAGLGSPTNVKVYQLLMTGQKTLAEIASETGMHHTQVTRAIEKLVELGKVAPADPTAKKKSYTVTGLF